MSRERDYQTGDCPVIKGGSRVACGSGSAGLRGLHQIIHPQLRLGVRVFVGLAPGPAEPVFLSGCEHRRFTGGHSEHHAIPKLLRTKLPAWPAPCTVITEPSLRIRAARKVEARRTKCFKTFGTARSRSARGVFARAPCGFARPHADFADRMRA